MENKNKWIWKKTYFKSPCGLVIEEVIATPNRIPAGGWSVILTGNINVEIPIAIRK